MGKSLESSENNMNDKQLNNSTVYTSLARQVADLFTSLSQVEAIALSGSQAGGTIDQSSDIDLYVYTRSDIPLADRKEIVARSGGALQGDFGMTYWGPGDEWFNSPTGIEVDIIYFDATWTDNQIQRVIERHEASLGYTTCLRNIVQHSQVLYDPQGWFQALQLKAQVEYPDALRHNIITFNHPVLRDVIPAYTNQLAKAVNRKDLVSVNHRLAALLASYFDIIFALNRELHPGEKRLLNLALTRCSTLPVNMEEDITLVIQSSSTTEQTFLGYLTNLLDHLDQWLEQEGFGPFVLRAKTIA